jgi:dipeptidyl aminopeptidase/acylaminoacyl peptidase
MRTVLYALLTLGAGAHAHAELPPLIDRDALFGEVQIANAQVSPDGRYLSFLKPYHGVRNLWVKRTDAPFAAARPLSAEAHRPIPAYFWSRDGKYLLYVQDQDGDENFNVYAVDPGAPPAGGQQVPAARNLTAAKGARAEIYDLPRDEPDLMYVGLNERDKAWHDLYRVRISSGERTLVRSNSERIAAWVFDHKGQLRLALRTTAGGDTEILRVDQDKFTRVYSCDVTEECGPLGFDADNHLVYLRSNRGVNLAALVLLDPASGAVTPLESDPLRRDDLSAVLFSELSDRPLATLYQDDQRRVYWKDPKFEDDYKWLQSRVGNAELDFGSHTRDERVWVVTAYSDVEPGVTYLFDRASRMLELQFRVREDIAREALAPTQSIRYKSLDGTEIQAYLTLPKGVTAHALPLVVWPHGGPWARDSWGFRAFPQFLANRGYAVLQPNFRGSTGFGKSFLNAGNGQWGRRMQEDLTAGVSFLIAQGTVDARRVGIGGGSYGGYATLAGVAFTPEVYAAAVSIVGPSNLITLLAAIPPYWEAERKIFYRRMADPDTPAGRKLLLEESPLNSAARIRTPLMVVQGAHDPRVNQRESDQIVIAARDHGVPVEYLVAPDEGHGFARPINNLAMVSEMERFYAAHLGGRFQASVPPEVAARLKEITVDPKTVVLAADSAPHP